MTTMIQPGVSLTTISTQKYKTIRLLIRFTAKHSAQTASARTLLTSLLETSSANYPTQTAFSKALADLYGASFGINVARKGNTHQVNVSLNVVNGKYVEDETIFPQVVAFLKEVLFAPHLSAGAFDAATFRLEQENLIAYLESIEEDKQTWAALKLQELYFTDNPDQRMPSFGSIEGVTACTAASLVETYQQMLANDQVDIFVVGDVTEEQVQAAFADWTFPVTEREQPELFTEYQVTNLIREEVVQQPVTQAKLNIGYRLPIYYDDPKRMAVMAFNGLFGGFSHSKLFMNVREKASLAYYASSSVDTFRGLLTVQTGIESENRERVLQLVHEQLRALQTGAITDLELEQTKEMLKNQYLLSQDYAQTLIEQTYIDQWLPYTKKTEEAFIQAVMAVTKEDVQQVANEVALQAIFFLEGAVEHGEA